ncbi:MAG: hypothetical protein KAZ63_01095 [Vitreoscilla sp.]|jgi:hypothetical protein|nr:hypothetical protein [Vitreoscilla sp.]
MTTSTLRIHRLAAALTCALPLAAWAQSTIVTAKINGDDQWKVYITTQATSDGYQYANGWGWPITYTSTLWLPQTPTGANYSDYWLNIWVQDVGGGGPDLLGEFKISGKKGCKFDNGTTSLLTQAANYWHVSAALPQSPGGAPVLNFPAAFTTYLPPYVQPMLTPADMGANGVAPWGPIPGINANARWISNPTVTWFSESWFQAHIKCK